MSFAVLLPSVMAILWKHREGPIPSLRAARAEVPAGLDQIFHKMLAKKPEDRFASMGEVVRALEGLALGPARLLLLPGEAYVEYQLFAQKAKPDAFVMALGYGECAPGYVPTEKHWKENDGNLSDWCWVAPDEVEETVRKAQS